MSSSTPSAATEEPDDETRRRQRVALAGHTGDTTLAQAGLADPAAGVRATALGALARLGALQLAHLRAATADSAAPVRARAAELTVGLGPAGGALLGGLLADHDATVVEAAAFACGEMGSALIGDELVSQLSLVVAQHRDPLCREAAVAALGAIGDPAGVPAILGATADKPAVRRRAVLALAPFDGPDVDAALARALDDRDWQVRQAAEDLAG